MLRVRRLLAQRTLAVLICAAALLLKLLVPTGYMIASEHGRLTIELCSGAASRPAPTEVARTHGDTAAMHGDTSAHHADRPGPGKSKDHGKVELPCAFSGLSAQALGAIDPILLVALIAFVMAVGLSPSVSQMPSRRSHLRPPLRGPPVFL